MSGVLSAFAQKLNIGSPKSVRPRTSRKVSLPEGGDLVYNTPGAALQFVTDSPAESRHSNCPEDAFLCYSPHVFDRDNPSPTLIYSSASCPSLTDLSTPNLYSAGSRPNSALSGVSEHFADFSPKAITSAGISPPHLVPDVTEEAGTLARRRGIKGLFPLQLGDDSSFADPPSSSVSRFKRPFSPLSPLSQRFSFNIRRRMDPDTTTDDSIEANLSDHDDFDPYGPISPSVFYSDDGKPSYEPFVSSPPSRPETLSKSTESTSQARRSPLNDLSVYLHRPPNPHADKSTKQEKSRLHIWVSGIDRPATAAATNPGSRDRKQPKLRPLILPNQVALREIAEAQRDSIVSPPTTTTNPHFRPLVLPQYVAHRTHLSTLSPPADMVALSSELGHLITGVFEHCPARSRAFPSAPGTEHMRRSSCEFSSGRVIAHGGGGGSVTGLVLPQRTEVISQPQSPARRQLSVHPPQEPPQELRGGGRGMKSFMAPDFEKPLPVPRDPLDKPLPEIPRESLDAVDGLISLLHQDGFIADSARSLYMAPAVTCAASESGAGSCPPRSRMFLKGSPSMDLCCSLLEAVDDRPSRSPSTWSIATQGQSVVWAYAL